MAKVTTLDEKTHEISDELTRVVKRAGRQFQNIAALESFAKRNPHFTKSPWILGGSNGNGSGKFRELALSGR